MFARNAYNLTSPKSADETMLDDESFADHLVVHSLKFRSDSAQSRSISRVNAQIKF